MMNSEADFPKPSQEDRIRERAFSLWQAEGAPEGAADRHWYQAEQELRGDSQPFGTEQELGRLARQSDAEARSEDYGLHGDDRPAVLVGGSQHELPKAAARQPKQRP